MKSVEIVLRRGREKRENMEGANLHENMEGCKHICK
jgi:hypothetical protein